MTTTSPASILAGRCLLAGRAVIGSWRDILRSPDRPDIICQEPYAIVAGDTGRVLCVEVIGSLALAATNHFKRVDGAWRLVHHQSSPIAQAISAETLPNRQIH